MTVGMRSRAVPVTPACTNGEPPTRAGPALVSSARACDASEATVDEEAIDMDETGSVVGTRAARCAGVLENQAENELPQPQPPVLFGFLNVKPEPCIDDV